jgi:hypothetical protein
MLTVAVYNSVSNLSSQMSFVAREECQTENNLPEIDRSSDLMLTLMQYKSRVIQMPQRPPTDGLDE